MGLLYKYKSLTQNIILTASVLARLCSATPQEESCVAKCQGDNCTTQCGAQTQLTRCKGSVCVTYLPGNTCVTKCNPSGKCATECKATEQRRTAQLKRDPKSLLKSQMTRPYNEMLTLGVNYIFPALKFQFGTNSHWSLGITSLLLHSLSSVQRSAKGYGINLGINYYLSNLYEGLWAELSPGINFLQRSTTSGESKNTIPSAMANIGWRWSWPSGMNFGAGGGLNYLFYDHTTAEELTSSRLYPSMVLDFGYAF